MRLADRAAIVAGAGWGGIGAAIAYRFAQEGARLVVNAHDQLDRLEETAARIRAAGGSVVAVAGDVTETPTWERLVAAAREQYGRLDILVYNPAHAVHRRAGELSDEEWARSMDVTLRGPMLGVRHCAPELIRGGGGSIIFISSINSFVANPHFGVYGAAKAGLNGLTRSVALDYGRDGIRCNAIAPGQIINEQEARYMAKHPLEAQLALDCYPLGRAGRPEDIAGCALFLASDDAAFVTGTVLVADGGLTIQSPEALVRPLFRRNIRDTILVPRPIDEPEPPTGCADTPEASA
jgi:NAD(P)-dependent dehydrogenase (short-subunit alcohol dehydrogenase family)